MAIRFVVGSGAKRTEFERAEKHTKHWDDQKQGFRLTVGLPAVGK